MESAASTGAGASPHSLNKSSSDRSPCRSSSTSRRCSGSLTSGRARDSRAGDGALQAQIVDDVLRGPRENRAVADECVAARNMRAINVAGHCKHRNAARSPTRRVERSAARGRFNHHDRVCERRDDAVALQKLRGERLVVRRERREHRTAAAYHALREAQVASREEARVTAAQHADRYLPPRPMRRCAPRRRCPTPTRRRCRSAPPRSAAKRRARPLPYAVAARVPTIATVGLRRPSRLPTHHSASVTGGAAPPGRRAATTLKGTQTGGSIGRAITRRPLASKGRPGVRPGSPQRGRTTQETLGRLGICARQNPARVGTRAGDSEEKTWQQKPTV